MVLTILENERRQIRNVVEYAEHYIYQTDDLLDMINGEMPTPSEDPGHLVFIGLGQWICYYLVDHPNKGRCHYFHIKPDLTGNTPDKPFIEQLVREFGIEHELREEHIYFTADADVANVILPISG